MGNRFPSGEAGTEISRIFQGKCGGQRGAGLNDWFRGSEFLGGFLMVPRRDLIPFPQWLVW